MTAVPPLDSFSSRAAPMGVSDSVESEILDLSVYSLESAIQILEKRGSRLKHLTVSACDIGDADMAVIAKLCPQLTHLNASMCDHLINASMESVGKDCPKLTHLDLSRCANLTDGAITAIKDHCCQLTYLDISRCSNITHDAVYSLQRKHPQLRVISPGLSTVGF